MILIVEDNPAHRELIQRAFEDLDDPPEVQFATSLKEAQVAIQKNRPDLMIIDLLLPDGRGIELIPEARLFPIMVMTSHGDEKVAVEAMKAGALDYIVKSPAAFMEIPRATMRCLREWGHIQARHLAEQNVRQSEERLRAFLDAAAQSVIVIDESGLIQYVNHQTERTYGYLAAELLGQPASLLLPDDSLPLEHAIQQYLDAETAPPLRVGLELTGKRKNGELFPASLSLNQINLNGMIHIIGLVADISQQKMLEAQAAETTRIEQELEQEKQLRQYKDSFLSMISHELRTPLSIIQSANDILKKHYERLSEEKRQQYFHRIDAKVEELDQMISDILLLSKSEMKMLEFLPQPTHLHDFLKQLVETLQKNFEQERITMTISLSQSHYKLDQYLLEHALRNLLSNALKYSPPQSPVQFHIHDDLGALHMKISDQGIGIPEAEQGLIFQAFRRGSNAAQIEGTGVGLAIVKEFVELHGGKVTCQSQADQGSSFCIEIPL